MDLDSKKNNRFSECFATGCALIECWALAEVCPRLSRVMFPLISLVFYVKSIISKSAVISQGVVVQTLFHL